MRLYTKLFIMIEMICYSLFTVLDICFPDYYQISNKMKFISICGCFLYTMTQLIIHKRKEFVLSLAMLFILWSDFFLLLTDHMLYGMITFNLVQVFLFLKIVSYDMNSKNALFQRVSILLVSTLLICVLLNVITEIDGLLVVSILYFLQFTLNLSKLISLYGKYHVKEVKLFLIGLILYFLCDINVGIFNLSSYINVSSQFFDILYKIATIAMWSFYLPGIVCIALCTDTSITKKFNK